jgi:nucleoside-diphosphate-sugar epimerase
VISALDWQSYFQANVCATRNLIEACWRKNPFLKKFVFISSISATGPSPKGIALNEESPCRPISDYGRSKLQAEQVVWEYKDKLPVTVIRPPNVIGPRQKELFQATQLIKRRILPLVGSGSPQTSLCSVFDLVEALCLVAEKPESSAQVYFVTDSRAYAWKEISEAIAEALGVRSFLFKVPYGLQYMIAAASETRARLTGCDPLLTRQSVRSARKYDWIYDDTKIRKDLGFSHHWTLKETIRQTIRWYKESGAL